MNNQSLKLKLMLTVLMQCTGLWVWGQNIWSGNFIGTTRNGCSGSISIGVAYSSPCGTANIPTVTLQRSPNQFGTYTTIATQTGSGGSAYFPTSVVNESGYYRFIISGPPTPGCAHTSLSPFTSQGELFSILQPPVANYTINGQTFTPPGAILMYTCNPMTLDYTGSSNVSEYRIAVVEATSMGSVVPGGWTSNALNSWFNAANLFSPMNINSGIIATRFNSNPGYYLVRLEVRNPDCTSTVKNFHLYVNNTGLVTTAAFKINNTTVPTDCNNQLQVVNCPGTAITVNNLSSNASQYQLELFYNNTPNPCNSYSLITSTGFTGSLPTDLRNLPGLNATWFQTNPGFYKVVVTTKNACGTLSAAATGYLKIIAAPTGANASFETNTIVKYNVPWTGPGNCIVPGNSTVVYKDGTTSCTARTFPMQHTSRFQPNNVGRYSTVIDFTNINPGLGSSNYSIWIFSERWAGTAWDTMNYQKMPQVFASPQTIPLVALLDDNTSNPYYQYFATPAANNDTFRITVVVVNECGAFSSAQIFRINTSSFIRGDIPTGLLPETMTGRVFPNPATSEATFEVPTAKGDRVTISLYDLKGSKVLQVVEGVPAAEGSSVYKADLRKLSSGMYFYKISVNNTTYNGKVIRE